MTGPTMLELADAVEKASGPDRALDVEVFRAIGAPVPFQFASAMVALTYDEASRNYTAPIGDMHVRYEVPAYTGSVDAAMGLTPPDHTVQLSDWDHARLREMGPWQAIVLPLGARGGMQRYTFSNRCDHAASLPLALTAASLRARHTLNLENARGIR
jgi:hypothetical protein